MLGAGEATSWDAQSLQLLTKRSASLHNSCFSACLNDPQTRKINIAILSCKARCIKTASLESQKDVWSKSVSHSVLMD